jgi:hypothetical protein
VAAVARTVRTEFHLTYGQGILSITIHKDTGIELSPNPYRCSLKLTVSLIPFSCQLDSQKESEGEYEVSRSVTKVNRKWILSLVARVYNDGGNSACTRKFYLVPDKQVAN